MKELKEDLIWSYKLYSLNFIFPILFTILNILLVGILGLKTNEGFFYNFKIIWIDYLFTGHMLGIIAFKWHLMLYVLCFIILKIEKYQ